MRLHYFQKFQTLFVVEFGLKPDSLDTELDTIKLCLDNEPDLKKYMQKSLQTAKNGDSYYLVNKKFWLGWSAYVGLKEKNAFGLISRRSLSSEEGKEENARRPFGI